MDAVRNVRHAADQTKAGYGLHCLPEDLGQSEGIDDLAGADLEVQFDEPSTQQPRCDFGVVLQSLLLIIGHIIIKIENIMSVKSLSDLFKGRGGIALRARLQHIDDRFVWMGFVRLADHVARFGISEVQGKIDLQTYRNFSSTPPPDRRPGPALGSSQRTGPGVYERPQPFLPLFEASRTLDDFLQAPSMGARHQKNLSFEVATPPTRILDPDHVRPVLAAIECRACATLSYQSMTSDTALDRVISPHSLVKASRRWHVRAFDYRRMAFIDFSLSRIASSRPTDERRPVPDDLDEDWHSTVRVEFVPHPALSEDQRRMVASEFGMKRGVMNVSVRRALLFYMLDELRLLAAVKRSDSGLAKGATLWIQNAEAVASELAKTSFDAS
jgi:hypothetical protein